MQAGSDLSGGLGCRFDGLDLEHDVGVVVPCYGVDKVPLHFDPLAEKMLTALVIDLVQLKQADVCFGDINAAAIWHDRSHAN